MSKTREEWVDEDLRKVNECDLDGAEVSVRVLCALERRPFANAEQLERSLGRKGMREVAQWLKLSVLGVPVTRWPRLKDAAALERSRIADALERIAEVLERIRQAMPE